MRKAVMYNKHTPLLVLDIKGPQVQRIREVLCTTHLPIILQDNLSEESMNQWMEKRIIPDKRDGINTAREYFPTFERYENMFSLSDQYWFRFRSKETWGTKLFTNDYSTIVGDLFSPGPWKRRI